jgi:hypothetical protein
MSFNSRKQLAQNIVETIPIINGNWTTAGQLLTGLTISSMDMSRDGTMITLGRPSYDGGGLDEMKLGYTTIFDYDTTSKTWVRRFNRFSPVVVSWDPVFPDIINEFGRYGDGNGNCVSTGGGGGYGADVAISNSSTYYFASHYRSCRNYTAAYTFTYNTARVYYNNNNFVGDTVNVVNNNYISEFFGYSIDCSDDGEHFIVGSPGTDSAYVYTVWDSNRLAVTRNLNASTRQQIDGYGSNVCVSGNGVTYCINGEEIFDINYPNLSVDSYYSINYNPYTFTTNFFRTNRLNYDGTILAVGSIKSGSLHAVVVLKKDQVGSSSFQYRVLGSPIIAESTSLNFGKCFDINDDGNIIAIGLTDFNSTATIKNTNPRIRLYQFDGNDWVLVSEKSLNALPSIFLPPKDMTINRVRVNSTGRLVAVSNIFFTQVLNFS